MSVKGYARMARPANCVTAGTGPAAAALVNGAGGGVAALLFAAGFFAYAFGTVLNDLLDREKDARARPERPIPRGEVRPAGAAAATVVAAAASCCAAALVSPTTALWYGGVCAVAAAYDTLKANVALRHLLMGTGRSANWAAGLWVTGTVRFWWAAVAVFLWTQILVLAAGRKTPQAGRLVAAGVLAFCVFDAALVVVCVGGWPARALCAAAACAFALAGVFPIG